jgi:hypothetical protein
MGAWSNPRQLLSCLVVPIAAFGMFRGDTPALTGTMHVARSGHQATLLIDGRVLVTGGSDDQGKAIGLAEVFNPASRAWSVAATNLVPRVGHAAVLLHDGRVLVVGGVPSVSSCEPIGSAEVYDPSTDRWSITSNIPVPVGRGTVAVSLKDGPVLISGGGTACGDVYSSAALFDPSSNTWSSTASMAAPAQFHVATLLEDGRVIVSGGTPTAVAPEFIASVYDPDTGVWAWAPEPRPLTGTSCDGYVRTYSSALRRNSLIARATPDDCPSVTVLPAGTLLIAGGLSSATNTEHNWVHVSDLSTGDDVPSWPMQVARAGHTATRLKNGIVLIAGGRNGAARLASSELYIPRLSHHAVCGVDRARHRLHGQARRRVPAEQGLSGWLRPEHHRRNHPCAIPELAGKTGADEVRRGLQVRDRAVPDGQCVQKGPSHQTRSLEQQLSTFRRQPEHRGAAWDGPPNCHRR